MLFPTETLQIPCPARFTSSGASGLSADLEIYPCADPRIWVGIHVQVGVQYCIQLEFAGVPLPGPVVYSIVYSSVPPGGRYYIQYYIQLDLTGVPLRNRVVCSIAPPPERGFRP